MIEVKMIAAAMPKSPGREKEVEEDLRHFARVPEKHLSEREAQKEETREHERAAAVEAHDEEETESDFEKGEAISVWAKDEIRERRRLELFDDFVHECARSGSEEFLETGDQKKQPDRPARDERRNGLLE
jgi:hypothetical protein